MVRYWLHRRAQVQRLVAPHVQKLFPFHKPEMEGVSPVKASFSGKVVKAPFDLALAKVVPFGQELTASRKDIIKVKIHKLCLNKFLLKVGIAFSDNSFSIFIKHKHSGSTSRTWM